MKLDWGVRFEVFTPDVLGDAPRSLLPTASDGVPMTSEPGGVQRLSCNGSIGEVQRTKLPGAPSQVPYPTKVPHSKLNTNA